MERTKHNNAGKGGMNVYERMQLYSMLSSRMQYQGSLGKQYDGDRNIYQALGYKEDITFEDYEAKYKRQDIAKAIIDRPVKVTWSGDVLLSDKGDSENSQLEKEFYKLSLDLKLKSVFSRVDRLSAIGEYGVLVLGLDDVKTPQDFAQPVTPGKRKLVYLKPASQGNADIEKYVTDPKNPRYGLPEIYMVTIANPGDGSSIDIRVHYTRIIHIVPDPLDSEIFGEPILKSIYNRLDDLQKIVGGDAEMFWRGARPGYTGKVDKDFSMSPEIKEDLINQIDEYEHNLRRMLVNEGVSYEALAQQVADPQNHVDIQIQMISSQTGIPKRILTGTERGELSSSQDKGEWLTYVKNRRDEYAASKIVIPFVEKCIEYGILPKATTIEGFMVSWTDLFSPSEKEKAEVGKIRATSLKEYASQISAESVVPPKAFFKYFLGLDEEQIQSIEQIMEDEMGEEDEDDRIATELENDTTEE